MSRLEQIKNEVLKDFGYKSIDQALYEQCDLSNQIAKKYAEECIKASLEKASENVKMKSKDNISELSMMDDWSELDKESIINPENIVLL